MTSFSLQAVEFRYRIFVSLAIVWCACIAAYAAPVDRRPLAELLVGAAGPTTGFLTAAVLCALATALRMSAGSVLSSGRVMSFDVRPETLTLAPPYSLVRNPIYLSDLIAATGFALCMPWPGLLYPFLLLLHYHQLIDWEEERLWNVHGPTFVTFLASSPRLCPTPSSIARFMRDLGGLQINADGARFNALYLLFIPGLLVSAWTGEFFHAVVIGLPGVADWAFWHTRKGLHAPRHHEVSL